MGLLRSGGPDRLVSLNVSLAQGILGVMHLDAVEPAPDGARVRGWVLDPDTSASIDAHIYVNGQLVTGLRAADERPDVLAAFNNGAHHGFDTVVPVPPGGPHTVCVHAINHGGGGNPQIGCWALE